LLKIAEKSSFFFTVFDVTSKISSDLKINTDLKPPVDGGYEQLVHLGVWRLYRGVFFY
jgi:hypothetical protein